MHNGILEFCGQSSAIGRTEGVVFMYKGGSRNKEVWGGPKGMLMFHVCSSLLWEMSCLGDRLLLMLCS